MKHLFAFWLILISTLLSACGQSGALYMPQENRQPADTFLLPSKVAAHN